MVNKGHFRPFQNRAEIYIRKHEGGIVLYWSSCIWFRSFSEREKCLGGEEMNLKRRYEEKLLFLKTH
jgi:hypothetical protein